MAKLPRQAADCHATVDAWRSMDLLLPKPSRGPSSACPGGLLSEAIAPIAHSVGYGNKCILLNHEDMLTGESVSNFPISIISRICVPSGEAIQ